MAVIRLPFHLIGSIPKRVAMHSWLYHHLRLCRSEQLLLLAIDQRTCQDFEYSSKVAPCRWCDDGRKLHLWVRYSTGSRTRLGSLQRYKLGVYLWSLYAISPAYCKWVLSRRQHKRRWTGCVLSSSLRWVGSLVQISSTSFQALQLRIEDSRRGVKWMQIQDMRSVRRLNLTSHILPPQRWWTSGCRQEQLRWSKSFFKTLVSPQSL